MWQPFTKCCSRYNYTFPIFSFCCILTIALQCKSMFSRANRFVAVYCMCIHWRGVTCDNWSKIRWVMTSWLQAGCLRGVFNYLDWLSLKPSKQTSPDVLGFYCHGLGSIMLMMRSWQASSGRQSTIHECGF